ncbi:hypothetical protein F5146DRAFT_724994 [Armillaria mellea]|nr:hypothetical protein F5146DRAFT_724994 [Armillaria mellea]
MAMIIGNASLLIPYKAFHFCCRPSGATRRRNEMVSPALLAPLMPVRRRWFLDLDRTTDGDLRFLKGTPAIVLQKLLYTQTRHCNKLYITSNRRISGRVPLICTTHLSDISLRGLVYIRLLEPCSSIARPPVTRFYPVVPASVVRPRLESARISLDNYSYFQSCVWVTRPYRIVQSSESVTSRSRETSMGRRISKKMNESWTTSTISHCIADMIFLFLTSMWACYGDYSTMDCRFCR